LFQLLYIKELNTRLGGIFSDEATNRPTDGRSLLLWPFKAVVCDAASAWQKLVALLSPFSGIGKTSSKRLSTGLSNMELAKLML
jgi:hypothetical protein